MAGASEMAQWIKALAAKLLTEVISGFTWWKEKSPLTFKCVWYYSYALQYQCEHTLKSK